jgi:hypothetical protein
VLYEELALAAGGPAAGQTPRGQPGLDAIGWQVSDCYAQEQACASADSARALSFAQADTMSDLAHPLRPCCREQQQSHAQGRWLMTSKSHVCRCCSCCAASLVSTLALGSRWLSSSSSSTWARCSCCMPPPARQAICSISGAHLHSTAADSRVDPLRHTRCCMMAGT